jgi:hypothetical protein
MSNNPYAAPSGSASYSPPMQMGEDGFVKQILIVGIFMIVEGVLESIFGIFVTGFAFVFPTVIANDPKMKEAFDPNMPFRPEQLLFWTYLVMGLCPLIAGIFRTIGGILVLQRKGRGFAIAANILGFLSFFSCYCIPTGLAASVYSLVILLQGSVGRAFAQRAQENKAEY